MPLTTTCSISVDLDPIRCYYGIHALGEPPAALRQIVLERCVPRFLEILARRRVHATFFVVGSDLEDANGRAAIKALADAGHEIANHSFTHPYELARLSEREIDDEVGRAEVAIADAVGARPVGFRAPGYDTSARVLRVLERRMYRYDSSVFGSWSYYAAKSTVMAALSMIGRRSNAVLIDPRAWFAPTLPYRPSESPFARGQSPVVELPIAVSRALRVPLIGTSLLASPPWLRARLGAEVDRLPFFNFELHGLDLVDAELDGIPAALVARQPDLRVSLAAKQRAFEDVLDRVAMQGRGRFLRLAEAANEVQRDGSVG